MKRRLSYRDSLVAAIRQWLPAQFFSRWPLRGGLRWTPQRLVWVALLMCWDAELALADRFEAATDRLAGLFPAWRLGRTYTGWCQALTAWSATLVPAVARRMRQHMQGFAGSHWLREGWLAFAADGSRFECPRTADNETELGCAGKERTAPQLFLTTLWHLGTGLPWDFRIGPGTASERRHLEGMVADLPPRSLVVADAGFVGYDLCTRVLAARQSFLLRVGANVHLLKQLGVAAVEGDATVYLWPDAQKQQPPLVLRLIVVPRGDQKMYLLTDVLDETRLSDATAAVLYEMRWGIEVFYRSCKQTLGKRRLLSRAPEQARWELAWAVAGVWLLGLMSVTAIVQRGGDPLSWSVAAARKRLRQTLRRISGNRRCHRSFHEQLGEATRDRYHRRVGKEARNWPHKKREKPPGQPKIAVASARQIKRAQGFAARANAA